jgi:uridine kinase
MMLPPTPRVLFLRGLVGELRRVYPLGRVIAAVDSGVTGGRFADDLALVFRESEVDTFRASLSGFHASRAQRTRLGPETPESYYRDGYDYVTLRRTLIDPFRVAGSAGFQTVAFDVERDQAAESRWLTAGPDAVLVIDGEFALRPGLRDEWNASVLLVNPPQELVYLDDARPAVHADILVDESDPLLPLPVDPEL